MPKGNEIRRPGELFLDRYMSNASDQAREEALANLHGLIAVLMEIDERIAQEKRDSRESGA
jgi:hypothetical protein